MPKIGSWFVILFACSFCAKPDKRCAEVIYNHKKTGTVSNYTLNVEVTENRLTKIYFPNGGWLDNSHFIEPEFDNNNSVVFMSDAKVQYKVHLIGKENCNYQ